MSLSCLVCEILVYRVYQTIPVDLEGKEGPILPTDKWVEAETMKSPSGWIEIHKDCLVSMFLAFVSFIHLCSLRTRCRSVNIQRSTRPCFLLYYHLLLSRQ